MAHRYWEGAAIASRYAKYRPVAPTGLINRIMEFLTEKVEKNNIKLTLKLLMKLMLTANCQFCSTKDHWIWLLMWAAVADRAPTS